MRRPEGQMAARFDILDGRSIERMIVFLISSLCIIRAKCRSTNGYWKTFGDMTYKNFIILGMTIIALGIVFYTAMDEEMDTLGIIMIAIGGLS